ncbi:DegV family protein [Corynebacterium sp. HS2168-gen11]|uniref:DegV family protein n=1 Tax=Corynebacterium sp. HS2168-gen11 TaxID=2974027 RepID=UPI00216B2ADA|nr:DegV family protein [Corynebacterium sp. HS2168-gen11]MCS4535345.1 DegV family protein [Corynebacterium sp. HS2168-gen11]
MAVRIVTDSSAGIPPQVANDLGITVIDLHVLGNDTDRSTSGLSPLELAAAYARQLERGGDEGVVALHLSKELSSTWSAAVTASGVFNDQVVVIDTGSVGMSVGAAAMAAARIAQDGGSLTECVEFAEDTLQRSETWIYLHRIDELRKSGRISTATAMLSTALATKPIMRVVNGYIELAVKTRTQTKAFAKLTELVVKRAAGLPVFVALQHNEAREAARVLEQLLLEQLPEGSSIMIVPMEQTLAVHTGIGAIGVSTVFSLNREEAEQPRNNVADSTSTAAESETPRD